MKFSTQISHLPYYKIILPFQDLNRGPLGTEAPDLAMIWGRSLLLQDISKSYMWEHLIRSIGAAYCHKE